MKRILILALLLTVGCAKRHVSPVITPINYFCYERIYPTDGAVFEPIKCEPIDCINDWDLNGRCLNKGN